MSTAEFQSRILTVNFFLKSATTFIKILGRGFAKEACPCCPGLGFHKHGYDEGKIASQQTPRMCYNKKV